MVGTNLIEAYKAFKVENYPLCSRLLLDPKKTNNNHIADNDKNVSYSSTVWVFS